MAFDWDSFKSAPQEWRYAKKVEYQWEQFYQENGQVNQNWPGNNVAAEKVLNLLAAGQWEFTATIVRSLGLGRELHAKLRTLMGEMYRKKIINRQGSGKFQWCINVVDWEPLLPLMTPAPNKLIKDFTPDSYGAQEKDQDDLGVQDQEVQDPEAGAQAQDDKRDKYRDNDHKHIQALQVRVTELELSKEKMIADLVEAREQLKALKEVVGRSAKVLEVKRYDGKTVKIKDVVLPRQFDRVLALARCRRNILLVGPAGCGKTHLARLVAKSLGMKFGTVSCTAGMSESHLLGRSVPNLTKGVNHFQTTEFLDVYEGGGLFLLDELDAADPNLLLSVNSALANDYCNVPNRSKAPQAQRHEDFVCIATANTFGHGADRVYAGRNQLDEATLDRFRAGLIECDYDEVVETKVCPNEELRQAVWDVRKRAREAGMRRVVSTRFLIDAYVMCKQGGWTKDDALGVLTAGWSKDECARVGLSHGGAM